tara:strand:+ start:636 stop:1316 length:681 start_codon:yes stop_codon:yes gene_type:complete
MEHTNLALFDLDHTLIPADSDLLWTNFLVEKKQIEKVNTRLSDKFFEEYKSGTLNLNEFLAYQLRPLKTIKKSTLLSLRQEFINKKIRPIIFQGALDLVNSHLSSGHLCALVTATNEFITEPVAQIFGFHKLIATMVEKDRKGEFTGRSCGVASFQKGKVIRVKEWLADLQLTLSDFEKTFFYSDSVNDIPLLEVVTNPVATNADDTLSDHAKNQGWPVINIFDNA